MSPARSTVTRLVAIAAGGLFVVAGVLSIQAAGLRWSVPCANGYDDPACLTVQDHLYDYVLPADPWVQIPGAAELAGTGYLLVAAALALLFGTVRTRPLGRAAQVLVVGSVAAVGLATLVSGVRGLVTDLLGGMGGLITMLWILAVVAGSAGVAGVSRRGPLPEGAWLIVGGALVLSTPIVEYFLVSAAVRYTSHDTHPWTGAWAGAMFLVAGIAVLVGVGRQAAGWRVRRQVPTTGWIRRRRAAN